MTVIVSPFGPQGFCDNGTKAEVLPGIDCIVGTDRNWLGVWTVKDEKPYIEMATKISIVLSLVPRVTAARHGDRDIVILVYPEHILMIEFNDMWTHKLFTLPITSFEGFSCDEYSLMVQSYLYKEMTYLVMHQRTAFLTLINITRSITQIKKPNIRKKRNVDRKARTFNIGDLTFVLMTILGHESGILASLFRDIDYRYSVRFYELLMVNDELTILHQSDVLQGAPSHVYSNKNGAVVVSDTKAWFFPMPSKSVTVSELAHDSVFPVTQGPSRSIMLDLSSLSSKFLGSEITCSTPIDDKRQLLINDKGDSFLIYLDTSLSTTNVHVNEFRVLYLNKSTLASTVSLIGGNLFLAAALRSHSVIFRVLHRAPYVDILVTLANRLPVMKMDFIPKYYSSDIIIGRYHEISLVSSSKYLAKPTNSITVDLNADLLLLSEDEPLVHLISGDTLIQSYSSSLLVTNLNTEPNCNSKIRTSEKAWKFGETTFTVDKLTHLVLSSSVSNESVLLNDLDEVCDLTWHEGTKTAYLILWNGKLVTLRFDKENCRLYTEQLPFEGRSTIGCVSYDATQHLVVVVNDDGSIFQKYHRDHGFIASKLRQQKIEVSSFRLLTVDTSEPKVLYIIGARTVFRLAQVKQSYFVEPHHILETKVDILDLKVLMKPGLNEQEEGLVVLLSNGTLSSLVVNKEPPFTSYYPKRNIKTFIKLGDEFILSLESSITPNRSTGKIQEANCLVLLNQQTLRVLDTYVAQREDLYVDLCQVEFEQTKDHEYVVVVANFGTIAKMMPYFVIKNGKITAPQYFEVRLELNLKKPFLTAISCTKHQLFILGYLLLEVKLVKNEEGIKYWEVISIDRNVIGNGIASNDTLTAIAEESTGVLISKNSQPKFELIQLFRGLAEASAVVLLKSRPIMICGDSHGNVIGCTFNSSDHECTVVDPEADDEDDELSFAFSIGDRVNSLCVILEEPLCLLVGTSTGRIFKVQEVELEDTALLDELQNNVRNNRGFETVFTGWSYPNRDFDPLNTFHSDIFLTTEGLLVSDKLSLALTLYEVNTSQ